MKPIKIVVIDSGIDITKSNLSEYVKKSTGFRFDEEGHLAEDESLEAGHEHGTVIAMAIKQICDNVEFISINILNERLTSDGRLLIHAFDRAAEYKPDIIHMSLGTTRWKYKYALGRIAKKAVRQNIFVVAAVNNSGEKSYPACIRGVVAVKADQRQKLEGYGYDGRFFYAPPGTEGIRDIEQLRSGTRAVGTSISAAYITGHIAALKTKTGISEYLTLMEALKASANIKKEVRLNEQKQHSDGAAGKVMEGKG